MAISCGAEGVVRLWELVKGKCVKSFDHKGVTCVDVLSGGRVACSAGFDNVVRFWDLETGVLGASFGCASGVLSIRLDSPQKVIWGCQVTKKKTIFTFSFFLSFFHSFIPFFFNCYFFRMVL